VTTSGPTADEVEISLLGPGYGECVVIHAGDGDWIIVDCCVDAESGLPSAIDYLESMGIDLARQVRLIVATHWHDDHVRGIGHLLEACRSAEFCCSVALQKKEFLVLVKAATAGSFLRRSGLAEFASILETLSSRHATTRWGVADRDLWMRSHPGQPDYARVRALSPSDASINRALLDIAREIPKAGQSRVRAPAPTPNHAAVALWVEVGEATALLGADLEDTATPGTGWAAVVRSPVRPHGTAEIFKVPHHGSASAHNEDVWSQMIAEPHYLVLTPFVLGGKPLPSRDDRRHLCTHSSQTYISSPVRFPRRRKRDRTTEKLLDASMIEMREAEGPPGLIRLRRTRGLPAPQPWSVELTGAAGPICS
jgi:hypothetical protein